MIDISSVQRIEHGMEHDLTALALVQSTILLAHDLRLWALTEEVETEEQRQILRKLGRDLF
jgi:EAL domain-containing protein (putative c-di-GMP-specific phosphodiesterase class I)